MSIILSPLNSNPEHTYIIHIDGDNFFASCELARFPHLHNQPIVVGRERGVAVAYNSHAKALGIVRAMPVHQIQREWPQVVVLASHFELYKTFSSRMVSIVKKYLDTVAVYSIDEVFCQHSTAGDIVLEMKIVQKEIFEKLGITVSIGIAQTKVLAKLATSVQKPNGVTLIDESNRQSILSQTPTSDIWGIGNASSKKLHKRGILTALDYAQLPEAIIVKEHAPMQQLYYELRGRAVLNISQKVKTQQSFQSTESFPKTSERSFLFSEISRHSEILGARILRAKLSTQSVGIYIKDSSLRYHSSELRLKQPTDTISYIINRLEILFKEIYNPNLLYKSSGVTFSGLSSSLPSSPQFGLFDDIREEKETVAISSMEVVKASIRAKYGHSSVYIGSSGTSLLRKRSKFSELSKSDPYIYGLPLPFLGIAA